MSFYHGMKHIPCNLPVYDRESCEYPGCNCGTWSELRRIGLHTPSSASVHFPLHRIARPRDHQRTPLTRRTRHRYDARLLLDVLPIVVDPAPDATSAHPPPSPDSPGGWSDLPSDTEDTFFLTPDETADLHRTKRLRHLDALRTARLRALSPDDPADADTDPWGSSGEEVSALGVPPPPKFQSSPTR
jgi:hypothetical protein